MFDFSSVVFAIVFGVASMLSLVYSITKLYIAKNYFNKGCLIEYENSLAKYKFSIEDNVEQIAEKMEKRIVYEKMKVEASIDENNPNVIKVNNTLGEERKNFAITHELGHMLRGYYIKADRNKNSIFSKLSAEEQVCDYYAAAILLPKDDLKKRMDDINFNQLNEESQIDFIRKLATEKHILDDVVYRRINEINLIYS